MVEVKRIEFDGISAHFVKLPLFSKCDVLKHAGIKESQLIDNDPEDEDNAFDLTVDSVGGSIVVSIFNSQQESIKYIGPIMSWEG